MSTLARRLITVPGVLTATVLLWVLLPVWLVAAAALSPWLAGRWRALRLLWLALVYATIDSLLLVVMFGYWIASGFGRRTRTPYWQGLHYDLVQGVMWLLFAEAQRVLRLEIVTEGPAPDAHPGQPLLICCRHAGPGDSFTLIHALMNWYDREPRVVLKDTLRWDPAIDVLLHRIPARFISPNPAEGNDLTAQIDALASGLDGDDAFVIFPEGGNFTAERRRRAIRRLTRLRRAREAERAARMRNMMPPRPGGVLAALESAPSADVVFVAHIGLDRMAGPGDVWRHVPLTRDVRARWWRIPAEDVPRGRDARTDWLYAQWERIDSWISAHRAPAPG